MATQRIKLLCVEDHAVVREGIGLILSREPDFDVVGAAATGEEALALFRARRPHVTLMDLQLPQMSGLEAIRAIRGEDALARIIVLTIYQGEEDIYHALRAGAVTYLLKDTLSEDLVWIIRQVHAGRRPMPEQIRAKLEERRHRQALTLREIDVIRLIFVGMRNKEIAEALAISNATVQVHVRNILEKLGAPDRTAAVHIALSRGILRAG